ncbi:MAG: MazG family protein [Verrucomicrobiae bacterium]|nr:MazG family protein [Verrucomicrobiae bacterium]
MPKQQKKPASLSSILRQLEKENPLPQARSINWLLAIMARLRAPNGCPWDREQSHHSLRFHAVEEVYELMDAIEAGDDHEMEEELGDLLLQVVFHCQLARERGAFDFEAVCRNIAEKLIRRHPHVFGDLQVKDVETVWANWDKIKRAEKEGTRHARPSALDGIPRHLPALLRAQKLVKKATKAELWDKESPAAGTAMTRAALAQQLFALAAAAQQRGWNAEDLLRAEISRQERRLRHKERLKDGAKAKN